MIKTIVPKNHKLKACKFTHAKAIIDFVGQDLTGNMNGTNELQELYIPDKNGELVITKGQWLLRYRGHDYTVLDDKDLHDFYEEV